MHCSMHFYPFFRFCNFFFIHESMYLSTVAFLGFFLRRRLYTTSVLIKIHNNPLSKRYSCFSKPFDKLYLSMTTDAVHHSQDFSHLLLQPDEEGIDQASKLLNSGGVVAFPTETVYGLGANALNSEAVKSVFVVKGRPLTDPLIVHILDYSSALSLISLTEEEGDIFKSLTSAFWPGPLTLIVRASALIPPTVTANTGFVGVRAPAHPLARRLLEVCKLPVAAPSANRFGHVSPTKAVHVLADLGSKGVRVLNGESRLGAATMDSTSSVSCEYGIESTVLKVDSATRTLTIFRQGAVTQLQIEHVLRALMSPSSTAAAWTVVAVSRTVQMHKTPDEEETNPTLTLTRDEEETKPAEAAPSLVSQEAPGQAVTHYSPDVPCVMVRSVSEQRADDDGSGSGERFSLPLSSEELRAGCVVIDFGAALASLTHEVLAYRDLSPAGRPTEAARVLFDTLRWAESVPGAQRVLVAAIPTHPTEASSSPSTVSSSGDGDLRLGLADRVFRAASGVLVDIIVRR